MWTRLLAGLALAAGLASGALAQSYPSRPITIVVPFPAGGTTDIFARLVGQKLSESLGQTVIIENKPGAGGNLGSAQVARAAADGYTLLMGTVGTHAINPTLYSSMPYDWQKDFAPVAFTAGVPNVLVVSPDRVKAKTVAEFIAELKAQPGKLIMASSGNGTSIHLSGELFKQMTGTDMVHVPYKGSSFAITDLVGGQIDCIFDNLPSSIQQIRAGKIRAIALTSKERTSALPDVPTIAESGVPGFEASSWFGVWAPANTPKEIVDKLNAEIRKAVKTPEMQKSFADIGGEARDYTPAQFGEFIAAENAKWSGVVKKSGAKVD